MWWGSWIRSALWMSEKVIPVSHIYPDSWWCDYGKKKSNLHISMALTSTVALLLRCSCSHFSNSNQEKRPAGFKMPSLAFADSFKQYLKCRLSRWEPLLGRHLRPAKLQSSMKNTNIVSELDLSPGQVNSNADRKVNKVQTLVGTVAARVESNVKPCVLHQCSAVRRSARPGWDTDMDLCRCVSGRLAPASCVYAPPNLIIMQRNQRLVLVYR